MNAYHEQAMMSLHSAYPPRKVMITILARIILTTVSIRRRPLRVRSKEDEFFVGSHVEIGINVRNFLTDFVFSLSTVQ